MLSQNNNKIDDTPLHIAVKKAASFLDFEAQIAAIDNQELIQSCVTINDRGDTIFDLINENLPLTEQNLIKTFLLKLILQYQPLPLHAKIDFANIVQKYKPDPNSELFQNLKTACDTINCVRENIKYSTSHPDFNGLSSDEKKACNQKLALSRLHKKRIRFELLLSLDDSQFIVKTTPQSYLFEIKLPESIREQFILNEKISEDGIANCQEITYSVKALAPNAGVYRYHSEKADHQFNIIGDSNPFNIAIMNSQAAICDVWSGRAAPLYDYQNQLFDGRAIKLNNEYYNFMIKYNPDYHQILKAPFTESSYYCEQRHDPNNVILRMIFKLIETHHLTNKEKFIFLFLVSENLRQCLFKNLINGDDLNNWSSNPSFLLSHFGLEERYWPLLIIKYSSDLDYLEKRLDALLAQYKNPDIGNTHFQNALSFCVMHNYFNLVKVLISHQANLNILSKYPTEKGLIARTVLNVAIEHNNEKMVRLLLIYHADANFSTELFSNPLFTALIRGNTYIVNYLLEAKADPRFVIKEEPQFFMELTKRFQPQAISTMQKKIEDKIQTEQAKLTFNLVDLAQGLGLTQIAACLSKRITDLNQALNHNQLWSRSIPASQTQTPIQYPRMEKKKR